MNTPAMSRTQRGTVLVIAMLFLLVVTIISVVAARNSAVGTKMSGNVQDSYSSFQSAEAGILATILLFGTPNDVFKRADVTTPFSSFTTTTHPLRYLNEGGAANMDVKTYYNGDTTTCPRLRQKNATSLELFDCEYYRIESTQAVTQKSLSRVDQGVVITRLKVGG